MTRVDVADEGKTLSLRLNGPELVRLQSLADAHHDGNLSAAAKSLLSCVSDDGDTITFRFSTTGAAYIRGLAGRRGGASRDAAELPCSPEDTIRRAMHLGCIQMEAAVASRGEKRAVPVIGRALGSAS